MRKAIIGAMGIIMAIIVLLLSGCQKSEDATQTPITSTVYLNPGQKLVSCGWKDSRGEVWYLTRPMGAEEKATEYEYRNEDQSRLIIIKEEARREVDAIPRGESIDMDMDAIRQMRMHDD